MKKVLLFLTILTLLIFGAAGAEILADGGVALTEDCYVEYGSDYSGTEEVALYLHVFWELPPNFLTKAEARKLGWDSGEGNLWKICDGMSIGGDRFGNREGKLPDRKGRQWYECDIQFDGGYRGAERLLYSSDGLIYYSGDHYNTYELLYEGWYGEGGGDFRYGKDDFYFDADWNRVFE